MAEGKRYYWLKLKDDFFDSKRIKKLRKMAGGDTYTIIYLKMQLLAMKHDGIIEYTGLEDSFSEELALDLDEAPDDVRITLMYLLSVGLAETSDNIRFFFPYAVENTGSEGASAQRMREMRKRNASHCDSDVTPALRERYGEKEIESEKEIEKERESERGRPRDVQECTEFFFSEKLNGDPAAFFDHYSGINWRVGCSPITDWKAVARSWSRKEVVYGTNGKTKAAMSMGSGKSEPFNFEDFMRQMEEFDRKMGIQQ